MFLITDLNARLPHERTDWFVRAQSDHGPAQPPGVSAEGFHEGGQRGHSEGVRYGLFFIFDKLATLTNNCRAFSSSSRAAAAVRLSSWINKINLISNIWLSPTVFCSLQLLLKLLKKIVFPQKSMPNALPQIHPCLFPQRY